MDGEYNFNYVTGLIELWSNISAKHPEMIVVGISGYDSVYYRHLMSPPWDEKGQKTDVGGADKIMKAIEDEIKPAISNQFRANDLDILSGHSMGGLFSTYAALTHPEAFDYFIAISPSLWWKQQRVTKVMSKQFNKAVPAVNLYMSLANEQGMGVHGFLEMVQAKNREPLNLQFKHFPDESHGSVGLPTYEWTLGDIFSAAQLKDRYFESAKAVTEYSKQVKKFYGQALPVNSTYLRNSCYAHCSGDIEQLAAIDQALEKNFPHDVAFFRVLVAKHFIKQDNYDQAQTWLDKAKSQAPNYIELHHAQYLMYKALEHAEKAKQALKKIQQLLKTQQLRQWQINEMNLPLSALIKK